jgi:uncharacterized protein (TIGR00369 family)
VTDEEIDAFLADPANAPPSSRALGIEMIGYSIAEGWAEMAFTADKAFANPVGSVQGGFVTAMLDDAMGLAGSIHLRFEKVIPTLQINVMFLKPTPFERVIARGWVTRMGQNSAQLQGTLKDADGALLATASASAVVRAFPLERRLRAGE